MRLKRGDANIPGPDWGVSLLRDFGIIAIPGDVNPAGRQVTYTVYCSRKELVACCSIILPTNSAWRSHSKGPPADVSAGRMIGAPMSVAQVMIKH